MKFLRRLGRLARLVPHLCVGLWLAATRLPRRPPPRTEAEWQTVRAWHRRALELIGVRVRLHGEVAHGPVLFAANHVSWLDIAGLATVIDAGFIGKSELKHWPVLGFLITRGGTIYIDRGGQGAAANATSQSARRLAQGDRVAVFPEGTTTDGRDIRRFHPRLFAAARETGVPVQPIALRYDHPDAPFVDNLPFPMHLWRVLGAREINMDIWALPPIDPAGLERRALARLTEQAVGRMVRGLPDAPRAEEADDALAAAEAQAGQEQ